MKLRSGDWEVYQMSDTYFQASQMNKRGSFSVHRTFENESEVQAFVTEHHLQLIGTRVHGTWPTRQYRANATKQTIQDAVWFHHIDQMSTREVAERYGCSVSIARDYSPV